MKMIWVLGAAIILSGSCLLVKVFDSHSEHDLIGTAVACTADFPFRNVHAEILEYGLQDVRGLACDDSGGNVFVSEGRRSLVVYSTRSGSIIQSNRSVCPEAPCEVTDSRGLAFLKPALYVAEHGRAQIIVRDFGYSGEPAFSGNLDATLGTSNALPGATEDLSAPSGVASAEQMLFITNDPIRERSNEHSGALYTCPNTNCKPERIAERLQHPSGVAAVAKDGPVYVAEIKAKEVAWPIFRKTADRGWIRSGALGSAAFLSPVTTPFLGIAINESKSMIFAAGPGGLYIFGRDGRNTGRIMFDDPVAGVSSCGNDIYFVSGHMLCRLRIPKR